LNFQVKGRGTCKQEREIRTCLQECPASGFAPASGLGTLGALQGRAGRKNTKPANPI